MTGLRRYHLVDDADELRELVERLSAEASLKPTLFTYWVDGVEQPLDRDVVMMPVMVAYWPWRATVDGATHVTVQEA